MKRLVGKIILAALVFGVLLLILAWLISNENVLMAPDEFSDPLKSGLVELDLPSYFPEELKHPQKLFSGRKIKIKGNFNADEETYFSLKNLETANLFEFESDKKENEVSRVNKDFVSIELPKDLPTGTYEIKIQNGGKAVTYTLPIYGLTEVEQSQITPSGVMDNLISRLYCNYCYWELASSINPQNENYGYLVGGGASDYLIQTTNAWASSNIFHINQLTNPLPRFFRGDPKLAFTPDGKLILASLLKNYTEPITGGLYLDSAPLNYPPQFTQILLSQIPPNLSSSIWIIFDYGKISVDKSLQSPFYGNKYVFANSVYFEKPGYDQGLFIVRPDNSIYLRRRDVGGGEVVTSTVTGPNGELFAATPSLFLSSFNGGETFNSYPIPRVNPGVSPCDARTSTTSNRAWFIYRGPELAVDSNGKIYAIWAEHRECVYDPNFEYEYYGRDYDIYLSSSTNNGITWTTPVKVNNDNSGGDQVFPSIVVDEEGVVYVAFLDHRDNQNVAQFDVYYAKSNDGGITFLEEKINDISVPNVYGHREPGDYLDMLSVGPTKVFVAYPCVNFNFPQIGNPSDACVTRIGKKIRGYQIQPQR